MSGFGSALIAAQVHCLDGKHAIVSRITPDPDGGVRLYLMGPNRGLYAVVAEEEHVARLTMAMDTGMPVVVPMPAPESQFQDAEPERLFPPWLP